MFIVTKLDTAYLSRGFPKGKILPEVKASGLTMTEKTAEQIAKALKSLCHHFVSYTIEEGTKGEKLDRIISGFSRHKNKIVGGMLGGSWFRWRGMGSSRRVDKHIRDLGKVGDSYRLRRNTDVGPRCW